MPRPPSAKSRIKEFLRANVGQVVSSAQIRDAAGTGVSEWARRVRELREDEHWPILTHNDNANLSPGQYMLASEPPEKYLVFARGISAKLRAQVLDRNGSVCQTCGITPDEIDPNTGRKARLHMGHIVDKSTGGKDDLANLRAQCSTCNQGAKNVTAEKPTWIWLKNQIRRANESDQKAAYDWLRGKFGD